MLSVTSHLNTPSVSTSNTTKAADNNTNARNGGGGYFGQGEGGSGRRARETKIIKRKSSILRKGGCDLVNTVVIYTGGSHVCESVSVETVEIETITAM